MKAPRLSLLAFACAIAIAATSAWAQQSVARLQDLKGNVLVSREAGLAAAIEAQGVPNGTRIITTANSGVIVVFDKGCRVEMKENQRLEVDNDKPCAALIPQMVALAEPALAVPLVSLIVPGLVVGGGLLGYGNGGGTPVTPVSPN